MLAVDGIQLTLMIRGKTKGENDMRKFISGFLVLVMLASMLVVTAAGSPDYAEASVVQHDGKLSVVVAARADTVSGKLTVSYDPDVLTLADTEIAGLMHNIHATDGSVTLGYAADSENSIAAGQKIAEVTLDYIGKETATQVTVTLDSFNSLEDLDWKLAAVSVDPSLPFTDVPQDAWFYDAVKYTYNRGWINGMTETIFQPNGTMTRAMFVTLLGRMAGVKEDRAAETGFTDVKAGSYYVGYVAWAQENDITRGTSATTFSPNAQVTREQMATFLYRYANYQGLETEADAGVLDAFSDANQISSFAKDAMAWAVSCEIIIGTGKGLAPKSLATRAQGTQILMKFSLYAD